MGQNQTVCEQSKFAKVKEKMANGYAKLGAVATVGALSVLTSSPAMAVYTQPDVTEEVTYIEGLMSGAGFDIAMAGLGLTIGIRGLKRIRGAF